MLITTVLNLSAHLRTMSNACEYDHVALLTSGNVFIVNITGVKLDFTELCPQIGYIYGITPRSSSQVSALETTITARHTPQQFSSDSPCSPYLCSQPASSP